MATVAWNAAGLVDGQYELAVRTVCVPSKTGNKKLDESLSAVVTLVLDRTGPRAVQQASKPSGPYYPGDEISIAFSEDVDCTAVSVSVTMSDATVFNQAKLVVSCLNNKVFVDFASVVLVCCAITASCILNAAHLIVLMYSWTHSWV